MNTFLYNLTANVWSWLREAFTKQSLNPNKVTGMGSWVESEMPVDKPTLSPMSSRDRSLPLHLRLEALQPELEQFDRALPHAHFNGAIDVSDSNF
ncbi:MAG: hypothetical protein HS105_05835 [Chloracidobacterium sp.]|nr:hypothetical protein [Chloracidobacterium sp.]